MFPNYPNVIYTTNGAGHQYNGLTLEVVRPLKHGLRLQSYYTWARGIGDMEDGEQPEDAYNRARERAVWTGIPTWRFSTNLTWQLPMGKGHTLLSCNTVHLRPLAHARGSVGCCSSEPRTSVSGLSVWWEHLK